MFMRQISNFPKKCNIDLMISIHTSIFAKSLPTKPRVLPPSNLGSAHAVQTSVKN